MVSVQNYNWMQEHTYHSWTWTGRTAWPRLFSSSYSCSPGGTYRKSTGVDWRTRRSACPVRLWRAVRVATVLFLHLHCLDVALDLETVRHLHQPWPSRALLSLLLHVISRSWPYASFLGAYLNYEELRIHLDVSSCYELLHQSPALFILLWGIQGVNRRIPTRSSVAIAGSSDGASRMIARESLDDRQAWTLYRHRRISVRWHGDHRAVIGRRLPDRRSITCGFLSLHFGRWPTDRRWVIGRCPTGRRRMRKSGEASCRRPANFNCELNLPDVCRMLAGWVLRRWITARFLQDSNQGSPSGDRAIEFAQLWGALTLTIILDCGRGLNPSVSWISQIGLEV